MAPAQGLDKLKE
jgi:DNA-binding MarR family transcriptional regulator